MGKSAPEDDRPQVGIGLLSFPTLFGDAVARAVTQPDRARPGLPTLFRYPFSEVFDLKPTGILIRFRVQLG